MYLYHYYNKNSKPFLNLSDLSLEDANLLLNEIRQKTPNSYCAKRTPEYMNNRLHYENILREEFDLSTLSFTYGDSHPTFSDKVNDGKEYRKNCIHTMKS